MGQLSDRNLLYGVLSLQNGLITEQQLIAGLKAWSFAREKPLGQHMVEQGVLSRARHERLDRMVDDHVALFDDNPARSLGALSSVDAIAESLRAEFSDDEELQNSITELRPRDENATLPYSGKRAKQDLSRFQILREHAKGGLGRVSIAVDSELNRHVALKEILPSHASDRESQERFIREAEITGGLEHPGIVPVYALGTHPDGRPYYAMRFVKGDSLREAIKRYHNDSGALTNPKRNLRFRELLQRFVDVCNAVEYAHSRGVLHRDLKPDNVMLGKYGETLVVDWGLAKAESDVDDHSKSAEVSILKPKSGDNSSATRMGEALGTPAYMSPEQAQGQLNKLNSSSDVYSLGATLFHLLTGEPPFKASDDGTPILTRVARGDFPTPRSLDSDIPGPLEAICLKAMKVSQVDRYQVPKDLADDLERWLADEQVEALQDGLATRLARWTRKHPRLTSAVAALAPAILVAALSIASVISSSNRTLEQSNNELKRSRDELAKSNADLEISEAIARRAQKQAEEASERASSFLQSASHALVGLDKRTDLSSLLPDLGDLELDVPKGADRVSLYNLMSIAAGRNSPSVSGPAVEDFLQGIKLLKERKSDQALPFLIDAAKAEPGLRLFGFAASMAETNTRRYPDAQQRVEGLITRFPDDSELWTHLATICQIRSYDKDASQEAVDKFTDKAREASRKAIELSPRAVEPRRVLAELAENGTRKQMEEAEKVIRELLEFDADISSRRVLVDNLRAQQKWEEALVELQPLLKNPVPGDIMRHAKLLRYAGQLDKAIAEFKRYDDLRQANPEQLGEDQSYINDWAVALLQKRRFPEALEKFEIVAKAYEQSRLLPIIHANIARAHLGAEQFDKAVEMAEKARLNKLELIEVTDSLRTMICAGEYERAKRLIEKVKYKQEPGKFHYVFVSMIELIEITTTGEAKVPEGITPVGKLNGEPTKDWDYYYLERWAGSLPEDQRDKATKVLQDMQKLVPRRAG